LPRMIVFDLDNTLWTPELYTLRHIRGYASAAPPGPQADIDLWLVDGALQVLHELAASERWLASGMCVAVASKTTKGAWARSLLAQLRVPTTASASPVRLCDLFSHVEIREGSKLAHFENLLDATGIAYEDMLFFDDARGGKYGNCEPVSKLGVLSVHTPEGLTRELFSLGLREFAVRKAA
ncbi:magnesium-dependent phosphatase-1, partial [Pavlovales sp. CCMP2436]